MTTDMVVTQQAPTIWDIISEYAHAVHEILVPIARTVRRVAHVVAKVVVPVVETAVEQLRSDKGQQILMSFMYYDACASRSDQHLQMAFLRRSLDIRDQEYVEEGLRHIGVELDPRYSLAQRERWGLGPPVHEASILLLDEETWFEADDPVAWLNMSLKRSLWRERQRERRRRRTDVRGQDIDLLPNLRTPASGVELLHDLEAEGMTREDALVLLGRVMGLTRKEIVVLEHWDSPTHGRRVYDQFSHFFDEKWAPLAGFKGKIRSG